MTRKMPAQKPATSRQDYGTPEEFIAAVEARWGKLDVDLSARDDNAKAPLWITPETDSLSIDWSDECAGMLAWLNPPFDDFDTWAGKCRAETAKGTGLRIIMLSPASIGANWFAEHVHKKALVLGLSPRITFAGETHPYPKDCMLSLFGFGAPGFDVWRWK